MIAVHATAASFVQRAAVVALLSFAFFFGMLIVFLVRQQIGYLILAAAFFVLNLFTLVGFLVQRRNVVSVFEKGLRYKNFTAGWNEIVSIDGDDGGLTIIKNDDSVFQIPRSINNLGQLNSLIREKAHI